MRVAGGADEPRPWKLGLAWLVVLGPFFFASYGFANWAAAQRSAVPAVVFEWEHAIPFLPWTIVPYWLIDLLYAVSLVLCRSRVELRTHVLRLLFVQMIAVACFLAFPLRFTFDRPAVDGMFGWMFAALDSFDQPYNQAPSLHLALLIVLWPVYVRAVPRRFHAVVHAVALLIGLSALTTWQHHFVDLPTGVWLGCVAVWLLREDPTDTDWQLRRCAEPQRRKLATYYASGAGLLYTIAFLGSSAWLWLAWPAATLTLVALVYLCGDGRAYGKQLDGCCTHAAWVLLAPYFAAAWVNAWWWTRNLRSSDEVAAGVYLGSIVRPWPHAGDADTTIVDLCAELPTPDCTAHRHVVPMLDLVAPSVQELQAAVAAIDSRQPRSGPILVACALGFSRSATVVAAWLVQARLVANIDAAIDLIRHARPAVVLSPRCIDALQAWQGAVALEAPASIATSSRPMTAVASTARS